MDSYKQGVHYWNDIIPVVHAPLGSGLPDLKSQNLPKGPFKRYVCSEGGEGVPKKAHENVQEAGGTSQNELTLM